MYSSIVDWTWLQPDCSIRKSRDQSLFDSSPRLIAAYYVLLRFESPRHPLCALNRLNLSFIYAWVTLWFLSSHCWDNGTLEFFFDIAIMSNDHLLLRHSRVGGNPGLVGNHYINDRWLAVYNCHSFTLFSTNRFTLGFQSIWYSLVKVHIPFGYVPYSLTSRHVSARDLFFVILAYARISCRKNFILSTCHFILRIFLKKYPAWAGPSDTILTRRLQFPAILG